MFVVHLNVVSAQSLHHKTDWTTRNLDCTLEFFMLLYSYTGCIFFSLLPKPIFSYEMSFYQNPIKYCNMATIYCLTLKRNTQYGIDPYCFTPNMMTPLFSMYIPQVIDEVDKDGKTPLMWAALRVFKYVCTVIRVCLYRY